MGQDLAAQRPAVRAFGRVGGQQVGQPVLLALGLLEMIFQHQRQRWLGLRLRGVKRLGVGFDELAVGAHAGGQLGDHGGQPGTGLRVLDRAVPAVQPRAVGNRTGQYAQVGGGPLERVDAVAQARGRVGVPEPPGVQPDALLGLAEDSIRLNPRPGWGTGAAAGLRDGVDTLERAATDLRVLARAVADSARLDSGDSPVKDAETRARLAAVIAELAASVRAYGQLIETDPEPFAESVAQAEPALSLVLEDHLEEAQRQQDRLADLLAADPAERPDGWPLRGEILAHLDRLRSELQPRRPAPEPVARPPLRMPHHRSRTAPPGRAYRTLVLRSRAAARVRARLRGTL